MRRQGCRISVGSMLRAFVTPGLAPQSFPWQKAIFCNLTESYASHEFSIHHTDVILHTLVHPHTSQLLSLNAIGGPNRQQVHSSHIQQVVGLNHVRHKEQVGPKTNLGQSERIPLATLPIQKAKPSASHNSPSSVPRPVDSLPHSATRFAAARCMQLMHLGQEQPHR